MLPLGADGEKDKIAQKQWFVEQLKAAAFFPALPIIVHEREAHSDCLDLLREHLRGTCTSTSDWISDCLQFSS